MVAKSTLHSQLTGLRMHFWLFGRAEARELHKILNPDEEILHCLHGYYNGGSALLVATDERLLLVDKRPFYLNLEEMRYEAIQGTNFTQHFFQATLQIHSGSRRLAFRSVSDAKLKQLELFISRESERRRAQFAGAFEEVVSTDRYKPYLNPAWRPHHTTLLPRNLRNLRKRPSRFYIP